jgi:hypothetical protein
VIAGGIALTDYVNILETVLKTMIDDRGHAKTFPPLRYILLTGTSIQPGVIPGIV